MQTGRHDPIAGNAPQTRSNPGLRRSAASTLR